MFWLAVTLGGALAAFLIVMVWGVLHMRQSIRVADAAIEQVGLDEVAALRDECVRVFRESLGESLDIDDFEGCAQLLSGRLDDDESLKKAFARGASRE